MAPGTLARSASSAASAPACAWSSRHQLRRRLVHGAAQFIEIVPGQRRAERIRQGAEDRPVLAGLARREGRALGHLRPALGVDVGHLLFGVGGTRQDDVGAMRAGIAMGAHVDDESGSQRRVSISSAPTRKSTSRSPRFAAASICGAVESALGRGQGTDVERADAARRGVQHVEAVPASSTDADSAPAPASWPRPAPPRRRAARWRPAPR